MVFQCIDVKFIVSYSFLPFMNLDQFVNGSEDSRSFIVRFTPSGSEYYTNLTKSQRLKFIDEFLSQLSSVIPCLPDRLSTRTKYQYDIDVPLKNQILFRIYIHEISFLKGVSYSYSGISDVNGGLSTVKDISADRIIENLDESIRNKQVTGVSQNNHTGYLDEGYGAVQARKFISVIIIIN